MARLGLDEHKDEHKQLYTMMKVGHLSLSSRRGLSRLSHRSAEPS